MTDAVKMVTGVTRDDAVKFLEQACRNWRHVPHLSNEDIADVMVALAVFARKANPANPTCNDSLQVAAPVKQSLTTDQAGALVAAPVVDHGITTSTVVDRAKGFYDTQAPLPTLQRLGQEFDAGEGGTLIAAGVDDYAAKCALRTDADGVFCHAYFYSDGQWRFQTGGNDIVRDGCEPIKCLLTKPLYAHPPQSRGQAFDGEGEAQP